MSMIKSTSIFTAAGLLLLGFITTCKQSDPPTNRNRIIRDSGDFVFSGYGWNIKSSNTPVGPGPNYFNGSDSMVWVDKDGLLHLRIAYINGRWQSSEVICTENMGYGTYVFCLESNVANINERIVLGLFTWDDNSFKEQANSEVDIEFSKWFRANDSLTLTYSVQPVIFDNPIAYSERSFKPQMQVSKLKQPSTHVFNWQADEITWNSYTGSVYPGGSPIASWSFNLSNPVRTKIEGGRVSNPIIIPAPGATTRARMNLWLLNGLPPSDGKPFEVVVRSFEYIP
jgi:hypothetical protein